MIDIHAADPAFGYRFMADELEADWWVVSENRIQRLCQQEEGRMGERVMRGTRGCSLAGWTLLVERLGHKGICVLYVALASVFDAITAAGRRLGAGTLAAADASGHRVTSSGPPAMPTLRFADDDDLAVGKRWSTEASRRGATFHPCLNRFLNAAHDDDAIDEAISIATAAFAATPVLSPRGH
jgi:hypothetical protein